MTTTTLPKLPEITGCGQTATVRIEIYTPVIGNPHGSLDGSAYTCAAHADAASAAITAADLTPYRMPRKGGGVRRCGDGFDYKARQKVTAPAPTTPAPTTPAPIAGQLAAALRAGATDPQQSAALDILLGLPYALYARQDLRDRYIVSTPAEATVLWPLLHDDLRTGQVPVSSGERRMLLIACSIAAPANPVSLNEVLTGLNSPNALLILAAVERIVRGHR